MIANQSETAVHGRTHMVTFMHEELCTKCMSSKRWLRNMICSSFCRRYSPTAKIKYQKIHGYALQTFIRTATVVLLCRVCPWDWIILSDGCICMERQENVSTQWTNELNYLIRWLYLERQENVSTQWMTNERVNSVMNGIILSDGCIWRDKGKCQFSEWLIPSRIGTQDGQREHICMSALTDRHQLTHGLPACLGDRLQ